MSSKAQLQQYVNKLKSVIKEKDLVIEVKEKALSRYETEYANLLNRNKELAHKYNELEKKGNLRVFLSFMAGFLVGMLLMAITLTIIK